MDPEGAEAKQGIAMVDGFIKSLRDAGVSHLYATAATRSWFDGGPLVVAPGDDPAAIEGVASLALQGIPEDPPQTIVTKENLLLVGPQAAVDRVQKAEAVLRPDLILPLTSTDRLDHMIVISLPQEARRELALIWPDKISADLPVAISPQQLVRDIERCVVQWSLPPSLEARLTVSTSGTEASRRTAALLDEMVEHTPELNDLIRVTVKDDDVVIELQGDAIAKQVAQLLVVGRGQTAQRQRSNDMKQVGLAIHYYYQTYEHLPPRCFVDPEGKPLLSGRVAILPFMEQQALYESFQRDQRWDHASNKAPAGTVVPAYASGRLDADHPSHTRLRFPVFPGSLWDGDGPPRTFQDVTDGRSNTIAAIDAPPEAAVPWASPEPWTVSADDPVADVFGDRDAVTVLMLDGSVRTLSRDEVNDEKLKALLTIAGGERVD